MPPLIDPPFTDLNYLSPMSDRRAEQLATFVMSAPEGAIVDVGCGWAELLMRAVEMSGNHTGIGIDIDAEALAYGRERATERGLGGRVTLHDGEGAALAPANATAAISIGAAQIWRRDSDDERLPYANALEGLRAVVDRGGRVVFGDGIWSTPPTPEATSALGGRDDEMVDLATLVDYTVDAGFMPLRVSEASLAEWDEFESAYSACYTRWLANHPPDHPDAADVRERARRQRDGYLRGYRGVLGLAYLELVAV